MIKSISSAIATGTGEQFRLSRGSVQVVSMLRTEKGRRGRIEDAGVEGFGSRRGRRDRLEHRAGGLARKGSAEPCVSGPRPISKGLGCQLHPVLGKPDGVVESLLDSHHRQPAGRAGAQVAQQPLRGVVPMLVRAYRDKAEDQVPRSRPRAAAIEAGEQRRVHQRPQAVKQTCQCRHALIAQALQQPQVSIGRRKAARVQEGFGMKVRNRLSRSSRAIGKPHRLLFVQNWSCAIRWGQFSDAALHCVYRAGHRLHRRPQEAIGSAIRPAIIETGATIGIRPLMCRRRLVGAREDALAQLGDLLVKVGVGILRKAARRLSKLAQVERFHQCIS
jgi:hypothetical protein